LANQIHRSPQYPDGESGRVTTWPIDSRRNILPTLSHTTRTATRLLTLIGSLQFGQVLVSQAFYPKESKDTDKNLIGNLQFGLARIYLYFKTTTLELYRYTQELGAMCQESAKREHLFIFAHQLFATSKWWERGAARPSLPRLERSCKRTTRRVNHRHRAMREAHVQPRALTMTRRGISGLLSRV